MRRYSGKNVSKQGYWDLGGTLNEKDSPSEVPDRDVIHCVNWRVHKDGKSREKRPGYGPYKELTGPPIVQIHEYDDDEGITRIVIVTKRTIIVRKDVPSYQRQYYIPPNGGYYITFWDFEEFDNKITAYLKNDSTNDAYILESADGVTWTILCTIDSSDANIANQSSDCGRSLCRYGSSLFISQYISVDSTLARVLEWNGSSIVKHMTSITRNNYMTHNQLVWDGRLWCISDVTPYTDENYIKVYNYNGTSWSGISDYDGAGDLPMNHGTGNPEYSILHRTSRLFVDNNQLYLIKAWYDGVAVKWTWQIWRFKRSSYDQFNKIYEHTDDYVPSCVRNHKGKIYIVGNQLDSGGNPLKAAKLWSSLDMVNWDEEGTFASLGFVFGDEIFDGRFYINTCNVGSGNEAQIYYYDTIQETFILEQGISTYPIARSGGMRVFGGELYAGKYREIIKRIVDDESFAEVLTETIEVPPVKVEWGGRVIIGGYTNNYVLEGDTIQTLGIIAPTEAPTVAEGVAGAITGTYLYLVTFQRAGNYPCQSNPSPESTEITVTDKKIDLSDIPISPDPKVNTRRIWRTASNGAIFYWLVDISDNVTTVYTDDFTDQDIEGSEEVSYNRLPPPAGKYFEIWDNKLWIAGVKDYPNLLYYTNPGTAEEMSALNFLNIKRREKDVQMQIKVFGDYLYSLKVKSAFKVSKVGSAAYEVDQLPQNIGTDASYSVAVCDTLMMWKSQFGIEVFNGNRCFRPLMSEMIQRTFDTINPNFLDRVIGGHNAIDHQYWLTIPTFDSPDPPTGEQASYPDKVIILDYIGGPQGPVFTVFEFAAGIGCFSTIKKPNNQLINLLGSTDGNLYIFGEGYTDDGAIINATFRTGWKYISGEKDLLNIIRRLFVKYILPAGKTITMRIYADMKETPVVSVPLKGSTPTSEVDLRGEITRRVNLGVHGRHIMFEFINNEDVGGSCRIMGWDAIYRYRIQEVTVKGD